MTDLRTRIEQLEAQAVEEFNEHMGTILGVLDYENIERIWIERTEREVREGRRKVQQSVFDLHIVRSTDEGTTYEDTVEHLSESEREVTRLVFALAGYLVHDFHETLPFMVVDRSKRSTPTGLPRWSSISRGMPSISSSRCCPKTPPHLMKTTSV